MHCYKLVDVAIFHPLRHHGELVSRHDDPEQRQHVRMSERFPGYDFLAEPLQRL